MNRPVKKVLKGPGSDSIIQKTESNIFYNKSAESMGSSEGGQKRMMKV